MEFKKVLKLHLATHKPYTALIFMVSGCIMLAPVYSHAELRDPTKPFLPQQVETATTVVSEKLVLSAIWSSNNSKRATINGVTAKEGEAVSDSVTIVKIGKTEVTVNQNGTLKTLYLLHSRDEIQTHPKAAIK